MATPHEHLTRQARAHIGADDVAGASALLQYREELAQNRRARLIWRAVKAAVPALPLGILLDWRAGLVAAPAVAAGDWAHTYQRGSLSAWRKGAGGERRTGRILAPLAAEGYIVMHDRAIPGSRANIDHLVIGRSGVWVIDSKAWHRRTRISGRAGALWIGGRPATSTVRALQYEHSAVTAALTHISRPIHVHALVAVHGAKLPSWGGPLTAGGATLLRARQIRRWIRNAPEVLDHGAAVELAALLDRAFPRYTQAAG
ncbi:nuclease-related domain-containing protein [Microtetraspora malaysiensis]|uniref:nuclease-related domain-containing protein n=1 Tax=Microtetraspora malaysiensis TaxID=161358 RepID=UPI003D923E20